MARIADELRDLVVPIESVSLHPDNPREGDVGAISESLRRFGQLRPIVVQQSSGFTVAGNHVLRAARALNWVSIAAHVMDLSDEDAAAYLVADNRLSEIAWYDQKVLSTILAEQARAGNLEGTGYDGDDVDAVLNERIGIPKASMKSITVEELLVWDDASQRAIWKRFEKWLNQ